MRKGREKAKQTAREREYEQNGFTANDIWQNTANDCTNQPASKHQWCGKGGEHGFVTNQVKLKSNNNKTPTLLQKDKQKNKSSNNKKIRKYDWSSQLHTQLLKAVVKLKPEKRHSGSRGIFRL